MALSVWLLFDFIGRLDLNVNMRELVDVIQLNPFLGCWLLCGKNKKTKYKNLNISGSQPLI